MQKNFRLTKSSDFADVRKYGKAWSNSELTLITKSTDLDLKVNSRFGFVVSKKIGNAVVRNRCKRHMREAINQFVINKGYDLVFIAKPSISNKNFKEIVDSMKSLLSRAKMIKC